MKTSFPGLNFPLQTILLRPDSGIPRLIKNRFLPQQTVFPKRVNICANGADVCTLRINICANGADVYALRENTYAVRVDVYAERGETYAECADVCAVRGNICAE